MQQVETPLGETIPIPGLSYCVNLKYGVTVTEDKNGRLTLHLPAQELQPEVEKLLEQLFPNTIEKVYLLLKTEALIASIE